MISIPQLTKRGAALGRCEETKTQFWVVFVKDVPSFIRSLTILEEFDEEVDMAVENDFVKG